MRKMKDSGVPWIGEIPEGWSTLRYKYACSILNGFPFKSEFFGSEGFPIIRIRDITSGIIETYYSGDFDNTYVVSRGYVLIGMDGDFNVRIWDNDDALLNQRCCAIFENKNFERNYIYYTLPFNLDIINKLAYSTTVKHLSNGDILNSFIPYCNIENQRIIANYLNKKCSQIDSSIANIRTLIDKLKEYKQSVITEAVTKGLDPDVPMKDSGVPWIGEIPETWDIISLKFLTSKIGSGKTPLGGAEVYQNFGIMFLRSQNIYDEGLKIDDIVFISNDIHDEMSNTKVKYNDILLNITGASIGRCCLFTLEDTEANVNQHVCIIRLRNKLCVHNYIRYVLNSYIGKNYINLYQIGGNRQGLNFEQIGDIKIIYPPQNIQKIIVNYLDKKCTQIDSQIAEQESLLSKLEAYKKSLIYECVTGKREVPAA